MPRSSLGWGGQAKASLLLKPCSCLAPLPGLAGSSPFPLPEPLLPKLTFTPGPVSGAAQDGSSLLHAVNQGARLPEAQSPPGLILLLTAWAIETKEDGEGGCVSQAWKWYPRLLPTLGWPILSHSHT